VIIQSPSIGRKLQRLLRLTSLPDSILAPETVPVILVEDVSAPLDDIERGCMGVGSNGAVAAENGIVVLTRVGAPATYDLRVTEFWVSSPTTQNLILGVPTAGVVGLTASGNTSFTNGEIAGRPTSQLGFDTQVAVPAHRVLWEGQVLADTTFRMKIDHRIGTIGIGSDLTSLMIAAATQNTLMRAGFKWTEALPQG